MSQDMSAVKLDPGQDSDAQQKTCFRLNLYSLDYFKTVAGIFHCSEVVLGVITYSLLASRFYVNRGPQMFLMCTAFLQWVTGLYFLVAVIRDGIALQSTTMWLMYHGLGSFFYTVGALVSLGGYTYGPYTAAAVMALISVIPHTVNFLIAFKTCCNKKNNAQQPKVTGGYIIETKISYYEVEGSENTSKVSDETVSPLQKV